MDAILDRINFYQLFAILWGVSMMVDIFRKKPMYAVVDAVFVVMNVALGEWICG